VTESKPIQYLAIERKGKVPTLREMLKAASSMFGGKRIGAIDVGLRCDDQGEWVTDCTRWGYDPETNEPVDLQDLRELKITLAEARKGEWYREQPDVLQDLYCYEPDVIEHRTYAGRKEHGDLVSNLTLCITDWSLTTAHYEEVAASRTVWVDDPTVWVDDPLAAGAEMVGNIPVDFGLSRDEALRAESVVDDAVKAVREDNANTTPAELGASLLSAHARGDHVRKGSKRSTELSVDQITLGLSVFGSAAEVTDE